MFVFENNLTFTRGNALQRRFIDIFFDLDYINISL